METDTAGLKQLLVAQDDNLALFRAEYSTHEHKLNFSMQTFSFMAQTQGADQLSFVVPYIWTGDKPNSYTEFQRHEDGLRFGGFTRGPQQPPKPGDPIE